MPYQPRGPREWSPRREPPDEVVKADNDEVYELRFLRKIKSKKDLPKHPDFRVNAKLAIERKDPLELYAIYLSHKERLSKNIGELLWFPKIKRGAIVTWETWGEGIEDAEWTDAADEIDALARWVWGETRIKW